MKSHADEQRRRNLERRDSWIQFAGHRDRTTRLLLEAASSGGRLCVLGAGNCNDLDLAVLQRHFDLIQLVDLDGDALADGIQRQGLTVSDRLIRLGDRDLTGLLGRISTMEPVELLNELNKVPQISNVGFTVVTSICLLSQLIEMVASALRSDSAVLAEAILAVRRQHLSQMVSLLEPGGVGLLISDFVSSDTCPQLHDVSEEELPQAAGRWIAERNFFTGTNPFAIRQYLRQDMGHAVDSTSVVLHKPWKWDLGPRVYAVAAIQFRRLSTERSPEGKNE